MTITVFAYTSIEHEIFFLLLLLCDRGEHYKYIVYCVCVFVCLDEMVYNIYYLWHCRDIFNMHKSFSFYLNIKFFAHEILNALSFQWFRLFGYIFKCMMLPAYHVGWLVFRYHFVFRVNEKCAAALKCRAHTHSHTYFS